MDEIDITLSEMITGLGDISGVPEFELRFEKVVKLLGACYSLCESAFMIGLIQGISCCSDLMIEIDASEKMLRQFKGALVKNRIMNDLEFRRYLLFGKLKLLLEHLSADLVILEERERYRDGGN